VNVLSTALLVALIAIGATALALSLDEQRPAPGRQAILTSQGPAVHRQYVPVPCPTTTRDDNYGSIDPGILVPTPETHFASRMPDGSTAMCYSSMPAGR
jgi:hypothetical protein